MYPCPIKNKGRSILISSSISYMSLYKSFKSCYFSDLEHPKLEKSNVVRVILL